MAKDTLLDRFWVKVDKEPGDGCWVWSGSRTGSGAYGQVRNERGEPDFAHRVAWRLANGPIPDGLFVCHTCDYPPCVRPSHLFLGTALENIHDSIRKGRFRRHVRPSTLKRALDAPSLPYQTRSAIVSMRMTPDELHALARHAKGKRMAMTDLIRERIADLLRLDKAA